MRSETDLRDAQQRTATHLYEHDEVQAVLPMGAGKTASALTAIKELIEDGVIRCALVLAPKRVAQLVWPKEPMHWEHLQGLRVRTVDGGPMVRLSKLLDEDADIYVVGVDNAQWLADELKELPEDHRLFDLLCIDEMSRFKNPRSKRGRALFKLVKRWKIKWGLTGTPRPNGYQDQFLPLKLLTAGRLWGKSFDPWRERFFLPIDWNGYQWAIRPEWQAQLDADISSVSITIPPEDMPDLPELVPVYHWIDLPAAARAQYRQMEKQLIADWKAGKIAAANHAVATGKLAQIVQGFLYGEDEGHREAEPVHAEKLELLKEMVEDLNGEPVLVAYEFVEDLQAMQRLWPGLPYLGAGVSDKKAAQHEADWNAGKLPILALHPASAGHGLNLQFGGSQMIWYGMTWSAELYDQTVKRFHRPGQERRCFVHHILARDTIDEAKLDRVTQKISLQEAFLRYMRKV